MEPAGRRYGLIEELAPARLVDEAEAEEAERGFVEDGSGDAKTGADEQRRHGIGKHVTEKDHAQRESGGAGGLDEILSAEAEEFGAHETRIADPGGKADDDHHHVEV